MIGQLLAPITQPLAAGVIAVLLVIVGILGWQLHRAEARTAAAEAALIECERRVGGAERDIQALKGSLSRQNAAVAHLEAEAKQAARRAAQAVRSAEAARAQASAVAAELDRLRAIPTDDQCARMVEAANLFMMKADP